MNSTHRCVPVAACLAVVLLLAGCTIYRYETVEATVTELVQGVPVPVHGALVAVKHFKHETIAPAPANKADWDVTNINGKANLTFTRQNGSLVFMVNECNYLLSGRGLEELKIRETGQKYQLELVLVSDKKKSEPPQPGAAIR